MAVEVRFGDLGSAGTAYSVQLVQTSMKKAGIWPADRPLSCVYDAFTASKMSAAIRGTEETAREILAGRLALAAAGIAEGRLDEETVITPSADRRTIFLAPFAFWGLAKDKIIEDTGRLAPCAAPAAPAPAPTTTVVEETDSEFDEIAVPTRKVQLALKILGFFRPRVSDYWDLYSGDQIRAWAASRQIDIKYAHGVGHDVYISPPSSWTALESEAERAAASAEEGELPADPGPELEEPPPSGTSGIGTALAGAGLLGLLALGAWSLSR